MKMRMVMPPNQNRPINRSAFTLAEVMIAMAIVSLVFIVLHLGIAQSFAVMRNCRENLRASQILEEKMETVRLYSWDQINTPGFIPVGPVNVYYSYSQDGTGGGMLYQVTLSVQPFPAETPPLSQAYSADTRLFVATLTWTSGGVNHTREMRTFASRYGLQNYVYGPSPTPTPTPGP